MTTQVIGNKPTMLFLTGLSGAGKSTLADLLADSLPGTCVLDGDKVRKAYQNDLPHGRAGIEENTRRLIKLALRYLGSDQNVVSAFVAPDCTLRDRIKQEIEQQGYSFLEIYVKTPLETCQERDPKGLYERAKTDKTIRLAGLTEKYDVPENPHFVCETTGKKPEENALEILNYLSTK